MATFTISWNELCASFFGSINDQATLFGKVVIVGMTLHPEWFKSWQATAPRGFPPVSIILNSFILLAINDGVLQIEEFLDRTPSIEQLTSLSKDALQIVTRRYNAGDASLPFEILRIEDEVAYHAAKTAFLSEWQ